MVQKIVTVREIEIGCGRPKIVVPISEKTESQIRKAASDIRKSSADIVEWRADFFEEIFNKDKVLSVLTELRAVLVNMPLLFTIRTGKEGGEKTFFTADYCALNQIAIQSGKVDLIDLEVFSMPEELFYGLMNEAHLAGVVVVGSNHEFSLTPPMEEIVDRICRISEMGADIPKIAVMPNSMTDVITLLAATAEMNKTYAERPFIAISMSQKGFISRISGELFGSAMTFGTVGKASAPGQISVSELKTVLCIVHNALNEG